MAIVQLRRRGLFRGAVGLLAMPAVVHAESLMRVKRLPILTSWRQINEGVYGIQTERADEATDHFMRLNFPQYPRDFYPFAGLRAVQ